MSTADIIVCLILLVGAINGYREGFLMELFSFVAIFLGILGGFKLLGWAMILLAERLNIDQKILPYVAFAIVFLIIVISVQLVGRLIRASIDKTFLGKADQVAGTLLGALKTTFLLSVLIWIVDSLHFDIPSGWTRNSWLFPKVAGFAPELTSWISEIFPVFRDVF